MRKTVSVCLLLVLTFIFSSCVKTPDSGADENTVPMMISGRYSVVCSGFEFTADITADPDSAEIVFVKPDSISGYKITCGEHEYVFDMCGVTSVRSSSESPSGSIPSALYPILRSAVSGTGKFRTNGDAREYETADAVLTLDSFGLVTSFSDRGGNVKAVKIN